MIRPFTLITMLLAALSGAYLFAVKHRAQVLDDQIASISQQSRLDAQRIRVLQAQWALEIDPNRLQLLASRFTDLQPMQPAQLVTLAALREDLPAPGSAAPGPNPELPDQAAPEMNPGAGNAAVAAALPQNLPFPPPLPPPGTPPLALVASLSPASRLAPNAISHSELHIGATRLAEDLPPPKPLYVPRPVAQTAPVGAQVVSVKATGTMPASTPIDPGSALGMAAELAPPQPLPQSGLGN